MNLSVNSLQDASLPEEAGSGFIVERRPDAIADQVLSRANQFKPPLDLSRTLEYFGDLRIVPQPIEGEGYLLEFGRSEAEILVRETSMKSYRWRFTAAHELGHWILRRFADLPQVEGPPLRKATHEEIENWCNEFAASLLMPLRWVKKFVGPFENLGGPRVVFRGSTTFGVSREAFYWRLNRIYGILFVEVTRRGKIRMLPKFYHNRLRSNNIGLSIRRHRKAIGSYFVQQLVPSDWKQVKMGPLSKGPTQLDFDEPLRSALGVKKCWTVLIARKDLTTSPNRLGIHGLDSFLP